MKNTLNYYNALFQRTMWAVLFNLGNSRILKSDKKVEFKPSIKFIVIKDNLICYFSSYFECSYVLQMIRKTFMKFG